MQEPTLLPLEKRRLRSHRSNRQHVRVLRRKQSLQTEAQMVLAGPESKSCMMSRPARKAPDLAPSAEAESPGHDL